MFSSLCASILGDAWMVHHEWSQRGGTNVQKTVTVLSRFALGFGLAVLFPRAGEHHGPRSIFLKPGRVVRFGDADAGEPGEGRHPTSALKNNKCEWAWLRPASRLSAEVALTSDLPRLTRIHRWARFCLQPAGPHLQLAVLVYDRSFDR